MMLISRLHRGSNDKYFLLANTGWRSLARFALNVLTAKLAGADTYSTLVLLLTVEVIVTTLLSAWLVTPMLNVGSGAPAAQRQAIGRYTLQRSAKWAGLLGIASLAGWAGIGFSGVDPALAIGFIASAFMACILQALRAWRAICFESWHVFWADLVSWGLPLAAVATLYFQGSPSSVLTWLVWSSAGGAMLASLIMVGRDAGALLGADRPSQENRGKMAAQGGPILVGSLANTAGSRAYPILLAAIALSIDVARFGAVMTLIGPMRMIGMALSGVVRTRFALAYRNSDIASVRRLMFQVSGAVIAIGLVMAAGVAWFGDRLCEALFGEWLVGASGLLLIGVWYGVVACLGSFVVTALQTQSAAGPTYTAKLRICISMVTLLIAAGTMGWYGAAAPLMALAACESLYLGLATRRWIATDRQLLHTTAVAAA